MKNFWLGATAALLLTSSFAPAQTRGYEVWLTDQNSTAGYSAQAPRGTHGGRLQRGS